MKPFLAPSLPLVVAAALAAQDAPPPPSNPPAPIADVVARALQGIDPARIERTVRTLVGFGTRHVLSRTDSDTEGTGAARKWLRAEYEAIAQASGGRLSVTLQGETVPCARPGMPTQVPIVNVIATLRGMQAAKPKSAAREASAEA